MTVETIQCPYCGHDLGLPKSTPFTIFDAPATSGQSARFRPPVRETACPGCHRPTVVPGE